MIDIIISGCGLLKGKRTINTKKGDRMAFVQVEDYNSQAEIVIFPSVFKKVESWLNEFDVFVIKGTADMSSANKCKILANEMVPLELFFQEWKTLSNVTLEFPAATKLPDLKEIQSLLPKGKAGLHISFVENGKTLKLRTTKKVSIDDELIKQIEKYKISIQLEA